MTGNSFDPREAIDVCRPDSQDLQLPELAELVAALQSDADLQAEWEAVQQWDRAIREALADVPAPEGLEARLLAALGVADAASASVPGPAQSAEPLPTPIARHRRGLNRRFWLAGAATAAAVAVVAASVVLLLLPSTPPISQQQLLAEACLWIEQAATQAQWQSELEAAPPGRSFPERVLPMAVGWRLTATPLDEHAVLYDLSTPRRGKAYLLVLRPKVAVEELPVYPPANPPSTTGGQSAAAWQQNGLVCVLLVAGGNHRLRYQQLIRTPGPVAALPARFSSST